MIYIIFRDIAHQEACSSCVTYRRDSKWSNITREL